MNKQLYICTMLRPLSFFICLIISQTCFAQQGDIMQADSLFQEGKYTESFEVYKIILEEERKASPSMLLKMAYIKEGLGGYSDALYYLNLYYLKTADRKVLDKMEELADKQSVSGYTFNDFEFVQTIFYRFYNYIVLFLIALSLFFLSSVYYLKVKKASKPSLSAIGMVSTLALLFYVLNFAKNYDRAIVQKSNTFFMSGPSAAAEVIKVVDKGNRIKILDHTDIWTQVEIESKIGYIKSDKLKEVKL